jgi:hypothetical protein
MKLKNLILTLFLLSTSFSYASQPKNAFEFLASISGEGGSGGAGNGGNNLISEYYRDGLVGLAYLKLTQSTDQETLNRIHQSFTLSKVYPVEFSLCTLDQDTSCSDAAAFASKNYPDQKIILVDARDLPGRYRQMTLSQKRRHVLHEFAGLARVELSNHHMSTQVDAENLYLSFETKDKKKEYFSFLGSYFNSLPSPKMDDLEGKWIKRSSLQPTRHLSIEAHQPLPKGKKLYMNFRIPEKEYGGVSTSGYMLESIDQYYDNEYGGWHAGWDLTFVAKNEQGLLVEEKNSHNSKQDRYLLRKFKNFRDLFTSIELEERSSIPLFQCKAMTENEIICRHFFYSWAAYNFISRLYWTFEYAVYTRTDLSTKDLRFQKTPRTRFQSEFFPF